MAAVDSNAANEEINLCAICMDRPSGARLRPCGHDYFCKPCAQRLFSCPLCRAPVLLENGQAALGQQAPSAAQRAAEEEAVLESRRVITKTEWSVVQCVFFSFWLFIFVFGIVEHMHDLRQGCDGGDPRPGQGGPEWLAVPASLPACAKCSPKNLIDCDLCHEGYYNLGTQCFRYLENMPALTTGAALGGTTYFVLIVLTQCAGILSELTLIRRLRRRQLMPKRELVILALALLIEVSRMLLVDVFVMQEYFGDRAYSIFREPLPCSSANVTMGVAWRGADGNRWCDDLSNHGPETKYYIASEQTAWSLDTSVCSTFTTASALLDFDEVGQRSLPGHTRFKTLGWVIGGEFALFYFFATFINEVADNLFVVPTTTSNGWLCKAFSVALEVFQLGALCPAAVFTHKDCLHFTDPLGVSPKAMSTLVITFGYCIWGFIFLSIPLAAAGGALLLGVLLLCQVTARLAPALRAAAQWRRCSRVVCCATLLVATATCLERAHQALERAFESLRAAMSRSFDNMKNGVMLLAFVPLLLGGIFLGTLVVVGQASKRGPMQALTAVVLLSDVLFKVVATLVTESLEYLLHLRVRRAVSQGATRRAPGEIVGRPVWEAGRGANPSAAASDGNGNPPSSSSACAAGASPSNEPGASPAEGC